MTDTSSPHQVIEKAKPASRLITKRDAFLASNRFIFLANGTRKVIRFSFSQRLEHFLTILIFSVLALTGISQSYSTTELGSFVLHSLGGIETVRQIHRVFAIALGMLVIHHISSFLMEFFTYLRIPKIWFRRKDLNDFVKAILYNLRLSKTRPQFDRYSYEQKLDYWLFALGITVLGFTGLAQWFPILVTKYLPGWVIPISRAVHHWQAIMSVVVVVTWHGYNTVIKRFDRSIFTGTMSIPEMDREHPIELAYLEHAATLFDQLEKQGLSNFQGEQQAESTEIQEVQTEPEPELAPVDVPTEEPVILAEPTSEPVQNGENQ